MTGLKNSLIYVSIVYFSFFYRTSVFILFIGPFKKDSIKEGLAMEGKYFYNL